MRGGLIVRPATIRDLRQVYVLARARELDAPNHQAAEKWWIRDFLQAKQIFFVATVNDRIVGFTLGECATGKVALWHLAAVAPRWRGKGVGTELAQAFEREARRRGMTCILLYTNSSASLQRRLVRHGYARGAAVREYQKFL